MNYKDTLLLPKTDFPMKADLITREPARLAQWEDAGLYGRIQDARKDAPLFVLHDGPPFANGDVHMGTALNKVLKDLIVKSKTMAGFRAPFVPGWDCHGLPIEFKVVKESRGLSPVEIRRKSEEYARKFIDIQRGQFKRLGVFGDWENPYLTLDPSYEAEIIRAFAVFVEKGLVYQSMKPVLWSTGAQTALAEAEVEYVERTDPAIYVEFPLSEDSERVAELTRAGVLKRPTSLVIWTTTPWTLPANVAIALHPDRGYDRRTVNRNGIESDIIILSERWSAFSEASGLKSNGPEDVIPGKWFAGAEAVHPFLPRRSKIITAEFVTSDTGTGAVHIAPGHGADDYIAGRQNGLPILSSVDDRGCLTEEAGVPELTGQYVFKANSLIIEMLRERGALLGLDENYRHEYPHCWRSKTPIVFRSVEQFFIKIDAFRAEALAAIDGVTWLPAWARNRIYGTVESRPDWCISRQRTWGVPLPVFYDADGKALLDPANARKVADLVEEHGTNLWFEKNDAEWASMLGLPAGTTRRNDTLDVWIDSGVSHTAVVAKRPELGGTGVADVYLEATDQHRGWFQSSLMTSIAMYSRAPYRTVITHGFVVDKDTRKKVSKSEQGTYAKPMNAEHFVGKYGADIVRLWAASVDYQNEVPFSEESFKGLAESYRSFRNILRILLANLSDFDAGAASLDGATLIDRWVLSRLQEVIATCRAAYAEYDFRKVFQTLNQFVTVEISALYVDITKDRMYCDPANSPRRRATQAVMAQVFDALARLLAPVLVFTADEAWCYAQEHGLLPGRQMSVHLELLPDVDEVLIDRETEWQMTQLLSLRMVVNSTLEAGRQLKRIGSSLEAVVTIGIPEQRLLGKVKDQQAEMEEFFILSDLTFALVEGTTTIGYRISENAKCARCWRHRASVGANAAHPELCERCAEVVASIV